jgi:hypothetical protein
MLTAPCVQLFAGCDGAAIAIRIPFLESEVALPKPFVPTSSFPF